MIFLSAFVFSILLRYFQIVLVGAYECCNSVSICMVLVFSVTLAKLLAEREREMQSCWLGKKEREREGERERCKAAGWEKEREGERERDARLLAGKKREGEGEMQSCWLGKKERERDMPSSHLISSIS